MQFMLNFNLGQTSSLVSPLSL